MTLWIIVAALAFWLLPSLLKGTFGAQTGAARIRERKREIYQAAAEYTVVSAQDYPHLDLDFYRRVQLELEAHAFTLLADLAPHQPIPMCHPVFIRVSARSDGHVLASAYNFRAKGVLRWLSSRFRNAHIIDLETEFTDGTFLVTTNAYVTRHTHAPPGIMPEYHPVATPVEALLEAHVRRMDRYLLQSQSRTIRPAGTLDEALAFQRRLHRIKADFEQSRGHRVSRRELNGIANDMNRPGVRKAADEIASHMDDDRT